MKYVLNTDIDFQQFLVQLHQKTEDIRLSRVALFRFARLIDLDEIAFTIQNNARKSMVSHKVGRQSNIV